jgi:transposase
MLRWRTGVYWKPVYKVLECSSLKVWIVNARHMKYVPGHKTDKKDSAWICKLLLAGLLKPSYIPEREQRELRDLTRYRNKLIQHIASEKNRIQRILEDCNIKLSSVMTHLDGVVSTKLIDMLINKGHVTMDDIASVYHKRLEASPELLYQACEGFIEAHHIFMLQTIRKDIQQTEAIVSGLTDRIKEVLSPYENVIVLLKKIPGLSRKTIEDLIAEIGFDMEVFPTEKHLASWAGMCPGNNESAGKKKRSNQPCQQTRKSRIDRSCLGGNPYQTHIL